jgi:hypothetical protein
VDVNIFAQWCNDNNFVLFKNKTRCMVFTRKRNDTFNIEINGTTVERVSSYKFLGVTFDSRLLWNIHIDDVVSKAKQRCNLLRCVSGTSWGADTYCMLMMYKAYIRSIMDYGCVVYQTASKTQLNKLDCVQSLALRLCLGALRQSPSEAVRVIAGEKPL